MYRLRILAFEHGSGSLHLMMWSYFDVIPSAARDLVPQGKDDRENESPRRCAPRNDKHV